MNSSPSEHHSPCPAAVGPPGEVPAPWFCLAGVRRAVVALRRARPACLLVPVAALVLATGAARGAEGDPPSAGISGEPGIFYEPVTRHLRVDVRDEPLAAVLDTVVGEADIALVVRGAGYGNITARFELPLEQGLAELLEGQGHVLVWDRDRARVRKILLLSPSEPASRSSAAVRPLTQSHDLAGESLDIDTAILEAELAKAIELSKELEGSQGLPPGTLDDLGTITDPDTLKDLESLLNPQGDQTMPPELKALFDSLQSGQVQN